MYKYFGGMGVLQGLGTLEGTQKCRYSQGESNKSFVEIVIFQII